jgi:hypothetical protein
MNFDLTNIQGTLSFSTEQAMQLLGINHAPAFRHHEAAVEAEELSTGETAFPPCYTTYEIPVFYPSAPGSNRDGVTNITHFHHPKKLFKMAARTRNTPHKALTMEWLFNLGNEVIQQGFAIDQHALQNDPNVAVRLDSRRNAHNWSQARHDMADQNYALNRLIRRCSDVYDVSGQHLLNAIVSYCQVCMHNTAHVSIHGMTSKQLVYTRIQPRHPFLGQINFTGEFCPMPVDYTNGCNYLTPNELRARTAVIEAALQRIHMHIDQYGAIPYKQMMKMFTMYCVSPYIPYVSWNWTDYPDTAIHTVVNLPDKAGMKKYILEAINTWIELYPNRETLSHLEAGRLYQAEQTLVDVCAGNIDLYEY